MIALTNAVDRSLDHGDAVVTVSKWALNLLQDLILDTTNNTEWSIQLENLVYEPTLPLVSYDRLEALNLTRANGINIIRPEARDIYYNTSDAPEEVAFQRHKVFFSSLFGKHVSKRNLDGYHAVQEPLQQRYNKTDDRQHITKCWKDHV
jgi:hypothetical protein